jgi:hypothetical protein
MVVTETPARARAMAWPTRSHVSHNESSHRTMLTARLVRCTKSADSSVTCNPHDAQKHVCEHLQRHAGTERRRCREGWE